MRAMILVWHCVHLQEVLMTARIPKHGKSYERLSQLFGQRWNSHIICSRQWLNKTTIVARLIINFGHFQKLQFNLDTCMHTYDTKREVNSSHTKRELYHQISMLSKETLDIIDRLFFHSDCITIGYMYSPLVQTRLLQCYRDSKCFPAYSGFLGEGC